MVKLEFGDDMLKQVEALSGAPTETAHDRSIEFDDKGTLHLQYRDGDDKLLHDTSIKTMEINHSYKDELQQDLRDYDKTIVKQSKKLNVIFIFFCSLLLLAVLATLFTVYKLKGM